MTEQAPRINAQYLEAFTGKTVMITGKVSQIRGESAVIDANGEVTVLLNRVRALSLPTCLSTYPIRRRTNPQRNLPADTPALDRNRTSDPATLLRLWER